MELRHGFTLAYNPSLNYSLPMQNSLIFIYKWARQFSRIGLLISLAIVIAVQAFVGDIPLSLQLAIALIALLVGIPHGAIDHLITIPRTSKKKFTAYIVGYILVAILAGWAIATWNLLGFQIVVVMSALHFGFGDAAYRNEETVYLKEDKFPFWVESSYAIPAGFLPVVLPLTDSRTLDALERIQPTLINWAGSNSNAIRSYTMVLGVACILLLIVTRHYSHALDLALLALLAITAPPLIAFAVYFGFWHAVRHTARLVPKLDSAMKHVADENPKRAIAAAVIPGLYAIAGTFVLALGLMITSPDKFSSSMLWSTLVIIWALTVPHMATTARFDFSALKK
jgi:Brp/Blh family beta-carotene 15,15'-monooxygenase